MNIKFIREFNKAVFLKTISLITFVVMGLFLNLWRIDSHYVFTDEVLYIQAAREYASGDYTLNLQHPLLGKYLSLITYNDDAHDIRAIRTPYAVVGLISSMLVYVIVKKQFGHLSGLLAATLYLILPFLRLTNRSVLLESPMHFFWLLFSYIALSLIQRFSRQKLYFLGAVLALALSVKFTSAVLFLPLLYILILIRKELKLRDIIVFILILGAVLVLHYCHMILISGPSALLGVLRSFKDVILSRNAEGKIHVVEGLLYKESPWWFYLYHIKNTYSTTTLVGVFILILISVRNFSKRYAFWVVMLSASCVYFQMLTLKNSRYIATMEIPVLFFIMEGADQLRRLTRLATVTPGIVILLFFSYFVDAIKSPPNSYNSAYQYLANSTNNFNDGQRILIFGSVRTSRWYFKGPEDIVVIRKDLEPLKNEFLDFRYILVDEDEKTKFNDNLLFHHLDQFSNLYVQRKFDDLTLYELN